MTNLHIIDWITIILYFAVMAWMGYYFSKRNNDTEEYFVGGRKFKGWVVGLSLVGTSISSVSFLAYPADSYHTSWLRMLVNLLMPLAGVVAVLVIIPFYRAGKKTSAYQYLGLRFGEGIRIYGSITFIFLQFIRLGIVLFLVGKLLNTLVGWDLWVCFVVAGIVVSVYTIAGGIDAVVWTDVIQTLVLVFGGIVIFVIIVSNIPGGISEIIRVAIEDKKLSFSEMRGGELEAVSWGLSLSKKTGIMLLILGLTAWLNEFSADQSVVQRYCGAASDSEANKAVWWSVCARIPIWGFFMFIGTAFYVFFKLNPTVDSMAMLTGEQKPEGILPYFVINYMPVGTAGLVIAATVAAAMSSLDSSINAISAVFVTDIYKNKLKGGKSEKHYLLISRLIAVVASIMMIILAALIAYSDTTTIYDTSLILAGVFGSGLLGLFFFGFFTKWGDSRAVGVGVAVNILYTTYTVLGQKGFVPMPKFDLYYTSFIGNFVVFGFSCLASIFFVRDDKLLPLENLTIWTMTSGKFASLRKK